MKKAIIVIITSFIITILPANACWATSAFFRGEPKKYTVQLHLTPNGGNAVTLSAQDTKTLIEALARYQWEEDRNNKYMEVKNFHSYYYVQTYFLTITSPYGQSVKMSVNGGGFTEMSFLIEQHNGKPYGTIMYDSEKNKGGLAKEDINTIKQLYFKSFSNFNNVEVVADDPIHIVSSYSFGAIFSLKIPDIILSLEDSGQLAGLYNRGWNNAINYSGGGFPIHSTELYTWSLVYTRTANIFPFITDLEFTVQDRQAIDMLKAKYMLGHDGEENIKLKDYSIYFQYKDGELHGQVKVYGVDEKLTHEFVYDKGMPVTYIRYNANEKKTVEAQLSTRDRMVQWIEYDDFGNITNSGKNEYQTVHEWPWESEMFYK